MPGSHLKLKHFTNLYAADQAATEQALLDLLDLVRKGYYIGIGWFAITRRRKAEFGRAGFARRDHPVALQGAVYLATGLIRDECT